MCQPHPPQLAAIEATLRFALTSAAQSQHCACLALMMHLQHALRLQGAADAGRIWWRRVRASCCCQLLKPCKENTQRQIIKEHTTHKTNVRHTWHGHQLANFDPMHGGAARRRRLLRAAATGGTVHERFVHPLWSLQSQRSTSTCDSQGAGACAGQAFASFGS